MEPETLKAIDDWCKAIAELGKTFLEFKKENDRNLENMAYAINGIHEFVNDFRRYGQDRNLIGDFFDEEPAKESREQFFKRKAEMEAGATAGER